MNIKGVSLFLSLLTATFISCKGPSDDSKPAASHKFSSSQVSAHFPYDLGPATVDVSSYPKEIQTNYRIFLAVCSSCHSSARPLNAPYLSAEDWKRYVRRMHVKISNKGYFLEPKQEKQIVDFLVYDSKVRKIDQKDQFQAQQSKLDSLFEEVVQERERLTSEEVESLPKKESHFTGVK
ncbi:MAG: hypothetical protein HYY07_02535 [Elusimicrobia bacterium]|nr:hypothetical protein [Elusimicrobiota bacterium]